MAAELRWVVPEHTTTQAPRLQYRNWGAWPAGAGEWQDVPFVVVPSDPQRPVQFTPGVPGPDGSQK